MFYSISAGTFIYIAASEIIVEEFSISKNKWIKLLLYFLALGNIKNYENCFNFKNHIIKQLKYIKFIFVFI